MSRERILSGEPLSNQEEEFTWSLRPETLSEYIGQKSLVEKIDISIRAAKKRKEPIEHILFHGPPGLGKTTLAHIIAREMGSRLVTASGPSLTRIADLMGILTNLNECDIFFIDEIHRLPTAVEEIIYPAMEDYKVDFVVDKGAFAKVINVPLKHFTIIGATTRAGLLSSPLRDRFGMTYHLDFYPLDEMKQIVKRSAGLLNVEIDEEGILEVALRSRGTPRIANRLLRRVRDYTQVKGDGKIKKLIAEQSLELEAIDRNGLDDLDRSFLRIIIEYYNGGPVGIDTIATTLSEEVNTLEELVEPYLLKIGFLKRTKKGRVASQQAYEHLGVSYSGTGQAKLL